MGDLLEERSRLCKLIDKADVADLTGRSMTWLDAPSPPSEDELLDDFLSRPAARPPAAPPPEDEHTALLHRTRDLLDMAGLRGAVMILAHAGHGNYLGLLNTLTHDGAAGHDLRADHEALFMQVAAVGVTATLLGTAAALPGTWS